MILAGADAAALLRARREQVDALARAGLGKHDFDIEAELERPYALAWVAHESAEVLGFLLGWQVADELHVLDVVVAQHARRRGLGRALVDAAMNDAVTRTLRVALLEVRRANVAARCLYRAAGFVAIRLRAGYYDDPVDDAVEMAKELAPGALVEFERLIED